MKIQSFASQTQALLIVVVLAPTVAQGAAPSDGTGGWKGTGNVTETRCQGMQRGPNCITHADRKAAAARAKAARAAAVPPDQADTTGGEAQNHGVQGQ